MLRKWATWLTLAALVLGLAACGAKENSGASSNGSVSDPDTAYTEEIVIKASNWEFDKEEYVVPKDTPVKITLELDGGHGINIDGTKLGPGNESAVVTLKEGTYDFDCTIICGRGHKDMKAKLIVK